MIGASIRLRVLAVSLLPALLAIVVITGLYLTSRLPETRDALIQRAAAVGKSLAAASEFAVAANDAELARSILQAALSSPEILAVRVYRPDGTLLTSDQRAAPRRAGAVDSLLGGLLLDGEEKSTLVISIPRIRVKADFGLPGEPMPVHDEIAGRLAIDVNLSEATRYQTAIINDALKTSLLLILLALALAWWLSRRLTQPIISLTHAVEALARDDYRPRAQIDARGELAVLRDGINRMAKHIQDEQQRLKSQVDEATEDLERTIDELNEKTLEANEQRETAERASEFKSRLVANVSHEIRTPLNAIFGFTDLLEQRCDDPAQREQLDTLRRSANNLLDLVNDLLDFSRLESGNMPWDVIDTDINQLLDEVRDIYAPQAQKKGIEYFVGALPSEFAQVRCDPTRMRQALVNLVSNAIKFTDDGHVLVRASVDVIGDGIVRLTFRISDSGIGIDNEQLQLLFTAFAQGDMSINRRFGGSGLGLHIFSEIVALMDGVIIAYGTPGSGSEFGFSAEFELSKPQAKQAVTPQHSIAVHCSYPPLRSASARLLRLTGNEVHLVERDDDRRQLKQELVVVCFSLREIEQLNIPAAGYYRARPGQLVAACTSGASPEMLDRLESLGYDGVLPRSANPTRLRRDIERLFHAELDDDDHDTTTRTGPGKPLPIGRVLVVDDQLINLRLMEEYLQVLGLEFDSFADGEHALESCAVIHYELILLDLHMPDLDGFTLARLIREQPGPNRDSVIFAVTADNHPQRRRQALEAGYNGLLIKPVSLKQLHNMIDEHCGQPLPAMLPAPPRDTGQPRHDALLELLLRELPEQRRLLQIALQTNDASALHELAHTLDGNARYCPTPELQRAAAKLAAAAQDGWRAPLTPLTVALLREIDRLTQGQSITN